MLPGRATTCSPASPPCSSLAEADRAQGRRRGRRRGRNRQDDGSPRRRQPGQRARVLGCFGRCGRAGALPARPAPYSTWWMDSSDRAGPTLRRPCSVPGAAVLGPLLGFPGGRRLPPGSRALVDPGAGQALLHAAVFGVLRRRAESSPVAVLIDDLHLAGRATLAWVTQAARRLAGSPVLIAAARREEEGDPLPAIETPPPRTSRRRRRRPRRRCRPGRRPPRPQRRPPALSRGAGRGRSRR